jgi:hypothetical protein
VIGFKIGMAFINVGEDKLHLAVIVKFVHKCVTIDYFGYLDDRNMTDNSFRRTRNPQSILATVDKYIGQIFSHSLPNSIDTDTIRLICQVIEQRY